MHDSATRIVLIEGDSQMPARLTQLLEAAGYIVTYATPAVSSADTGDMFNRSSSARLEPLRRDAKNPHAAALGRLGGLKGGQARAHTLTALQRRAIARKAARARWSKVARARHHD